MSAVMTSLSMPSLGTKYSFSRDDAAALRLGRMMNVVEWRRGGDEEGPRREEEREKEEEEEEEDRE